MEYRVIKRKVCDDKIVYECQQEIMGIFRMMEVIKSKPSGWDVWCGTDKRSAIFNTLDEAKSFIEQYKNAIAEEVVFRTK
jgi:hypothetical protein